MEPHKESSLKLFLLLNPYGVDIDGFTHAIVCAKDEQEARQIHPSSMYYPHPSSNDFWAFTSRGLDKNGDYYRDEEGTVMDSHWPKTPEEVVVEYIGEAAEHLKAGCIINHTQTN